jgi:hypothetical protein
VNFIAGGFQRLFPAAHDEQPRAQLGEVDGHRPTEPAPTARKENGTILQKAGLKHDAPPFEMVTAL